MDYDEAIDDVANLITVTGLPKPRILGAERRHAAETRVLAAARRRPGPPKRAFLADRRRGGVSAPPRHRISAASECLPYN